MLLWLCNLVFFVGGLEKKNVLDLFIKKKKKKKKKKKTPNQKKKKTTKTCLLFPQQLALLYY